MYILFQFFIIYRKVLTSIQIIDLKLTKLNTVFIYIYEKYFRLQDQLMMTNHTM